MSAQLKIGCFEEIQMLNMKMALSGAGPICEAVRETTQFALIKPKRKLRTGVDT